MIQQKIHFCVIISCVLFKVYGHESEINDVEKRMLVGSVDIQNEFSLLKATVQEMQSKLSQQELQLKSYESKLAQQDIVIQNLQGNGGTYTRWGRKDCPTDNATELVYSGFAGGSHYSHSGAAADYVCLPTDPILSKVDVSITKPPTTNIYSGFIYGSEYETNFFGFHAQDEDVPCAVCRSKVRSTILMIPGRNQCYNGWHIEYEGNLASGLYTHAAASQYACVDGSPEFLDKGQANENGKLFYPVLTACGSLPCPPYENHKIMTCVVCSK